LAILRVGVGGYVCSQHGSLVERPNPARDVGVEEELISSPLLDDGSDSSDFEVHD